ncbi:MAG TPA: GAF domain-containing protein [Vicinamibacterales bacterium]
MRIACLVVGLLATAGLSYRIFQDENTLSAEQRSASAAIDASAQTAELLLDLRGSLHAYVAPGQGLPFWAKRAHDGIESVRESLTTLDKVVSPTGRSVSESLDAVDQLAAAERTARNYVSRGELQLAGDVIFTEIRDLLATATNQVQSVRNDLKRAQDRRSAGLRNEQVMLAGLAVAIWIGIAVLFLPMPNQAPATDSATWRHELKQRLEKPVATAAAVAVAEAAAPPPPAAPTPVVPSEPVVALTSVRRVSEICADLSALVDPEGLPSALDRVNSVLNATGLIVWVASPDAASLVPVATHGFDPKLVERIGRIPRDSANLTASAFRDNAPKFSATTTTSPGALAAPMCGPTGPAGVLSVELKAGQAVEESTVALAAIVAAQLATLAMPIPEVAADDFDAAPGMAVAEVTEPKRAAR